MSVAAARSRPLFTDGELVELGRLDGVRVAFDDSVALDPLSAAALDAEPDGSPARRKLEALGALAGASAAAPAEAARRLTFRFLRSPLELIEQAGRVSAIRLAVNRLVAREGRVVAEPTGAEETLACGLVVTAVGHSAAPPPGLPLAGGVIANRDGRVDGRAREYVVGWAKRGPSGVIGTNKGDAQETVARIVADGEAGLLARDAATPSTPDPEAVAARAGPRPRRVGRLGGDRRPRARTRRAGRTPTGKARRPRRDGDGRLRAARVIRRRDLSPVAAPGPASIAAVAARS